MMTGGGDTLLNLALQDFSQEFSTVQKEVIVHIIENVSVFGVIADVIKVGEKGLKLFKEKCFGFVAGAYGDIHSEAAMDILLQVLQPEKLPEKYFFGSGRAAALLAFQEREVIEQ